MKQFQYLHKLNRGDKVAILAPSSVAAAIWPHVYELGIKRLQNEFGLIPVEFSSTRKKETSWNERINDLEKAFLDGEIKAIITTIGGKDEVNYVSTISPEVFIANPKPFFGFSDNTHLENFLWINGIPSYYGGSLLTQYAASGTIDKFTKKYLEIALFENGEFELNQSDNFNDVVEDWNDPLSLNHERKFESNEGWIWDGDLTLDGISWGGCLESIDEIMKNEIKIPSLDEFDEIVLITETSEGIPDSAYCRNVYHDLGKRGILSKVRAVLNGRPQGWFFNKQLNIAEKQKYREEQRKVILETVREYNLNCPVIQNIDFGHTSPQIPIPYGRKIRIDSGSKKIFAEF